MPIFNSYRESIIIKDHVKAKHIIAGDYSYYSGYYHDKAFEDCVMYLDEADNHQDRKHKYFVSFKLLFDMLLKCICPN